MRGIGFVALVLALGGFPTAWAGDVPDAAALHAEGTALLAAGRFEDAYESFRAATAAAPGEAAYARDAAVLRRVLALRRIAARPERTPAWEKAAVTLHRFYLRRRLHAAAVALDLQALTTLQSAAAEARLAETWLAAGRPGEVIELLAKPVPWRRSTLHGVYRGIAWARARQFEPALEIAAGLELPPKADPAILREAARLHALLGRDEPCAALLVRAFRATPTAALASLKAEVRAEPDFTRVRASPAFVQAMATVSAQAAPACSGGTDCGSCPSRGACGGKK